ncbi:MAG TPA: S8 family peptidase, partial [Tepidisphaeraceae bacterium]
MNKHLAGLRSLFKGFEQRRPASAPPCSLQLESLEGRLLLSGASTVTWHGVQTQAIDGQYVAHLNTDVDFQKLAARKGFTNVATIADGYFQFDSPKSVGQMQRLASKLRAKVSISPNEISHLDFVPNDEFYGNQWHLHNTGALVTDPSGFSDPQNGAVGADIEAEKAWDITTGSRDVVVAVLDTGIDYNHPDLAANMFTNTKEIAGNGIDDDGNGFVDDTRGWNFDENTNDPIDLNGHGTNVAGIIGAVGNNGIGVSGVAQQVQLLPVRIFPADGGATDATIIAGIEYITMLKHEGFNIVAINASLGGQTFPFDEVESAAVADAGTAGIVFLAAAGNDSINNDAFQSFPAKYSLNLPNVITVAATDNQDKLAGFSNYGAASVDVAAPGVGIFATAPSYDTTITGELVGVEDFRQYAALSGTSQATPIVTGIVALEKAANPNATVAQLKQAVLDGAVQIPSLHSPYNIPNVVATGGRVDAYRSIRNIQNQFVTGDVFSEGNWQGSYGQQGAYVVGDSTAFPDFAPVVATGGVSKVINASTSNPVALQKVTDPNSRIEGYFSTADTMTFDMNFTDTATHRVTLYAADYERLGRSERVDILDASSGAILDTQFIPDFKQGEYLQWDLQGAVQIKVTNTSANPSPTVTDPNPARPDAVVSGLFFDTPTQSPFLFTGTDTTTRGAWMGTFGSEGLFLPGQSSA